MARALYGAPLHLRCGSVCTVVKAPRMARALYGAPLHVPPRLALWGFTVVLE